VQHLAQSALLGQRPELLDRLNLDLADTLAGEFELFGDVLLELVVIVPIEAEASEHDALLALVQLQQNPLKLLLEFLA
jgi:hypothetical protein